jgi:tetratricopeptide (TPR) repeat protein
MPSRWTALVLLAAVTARAVYFVQYARSPYFGYFRNDHLYYREWGLRIAAGEWLGSKPFEQGPLYAYLLGAAYKLLGPRDSLILALQLVSGLVTVALVLFCARTLWGDRAGVIAGLLAALHGPSIFYECMIMKTFLEPLLVMAALAAALQGAESGRSRWFSAAGGAVGLSCLVREVHAVLLAPLILAAVLSPGRPAQPRPRRLLSAGAVLLTFILVLAPAILRNRAVAESSATVTTGAGELFYSAFGPLATGYSFLTPFSGGLAYQEHEDYREEAFLRTGRRLTVNESSRFWLGEALRQVRESPWGTVRLLGIKAAILFNDLEIPDSEDFAATGAFVPLLGFLPTFGWISGLGFLGLGWSLRRRGEVLVPAGFAAALVLEILLTVNSGRYRAGLVAVWLMFAGGGLAALTSGEFWLRTPGLRFRLALVAAAASLSLMAFRPTPRMDPRRLAEIHDLFKRTALDNAVSVGRIPALRQAIAARPRNPKILEQLGLTLWNAGRVAEAAEAYEEVLRIDPKVVTARFRLANIHARVGNLERAAAEARLLVALLPENARGHVLLGQILFRQAMNAASDSDYARQFNEARSCFEKATGLDPNSGEAHYELGKSRYLGGDRRGALRELGLARLLAPEHRRAAHLDQLIRESTDHRPLGEGLP